MRTTLDIDPDVLQAAKELAQRERSTAGKVISDLARRGLNRVGSKKTKYHLVNGVPVLPHRGGEVITMEHIQRIMDEEGI